MVPTCRTLSLFILSSDRGIVQFTYGDDGLDPAGMEAKDRPVDMARVLAQAKTTHPCPAEPPLSADEIATAVDQMRYVCVCTCMYVRACSCVCACVYLCVGERVLIFMVFFWI